MSTTVEQLQAQEREARQRAFEEYATVVRELAAGTCERSSLEVGSILRAADMAAGDLHEDVGNLKQYARAAAELEHLKATTVVEDPDAMRAEVRRLREKIAADQRELDLLQFKLGRPDEGSRRIANATARLRDAETRLRVKPS